MVNRHRETVGLRSAIAMGLGPAGLEASARKRARIASARASVVVCAAWIVFSSRPGLAQEVVVPVALQAELVVKVASYDRNLARRAGDRVHVLLLVKANNDASSQFASRMTSALGGVDTIGGLPHDEATTSWTSAKDLVDTCHAKKISIVYLAPGLADDVPTIRGALEGVNVLSVAAVAAEVPKGIVLGFDLVSGKPKIVIHLGQAKKQDVSFKAELLKLAKVHE